MIQPVRTNCPTDSVFNRKNLPKGESNLHGWYASEWTSMSIDQMASENLRLKVRSLVVHSTRCNHLDGRHFKQKMGSRPNPWERLPMTSRFVAIGDGNGLESFKPTALPDPRSRGYNKRQVLKIRLAGVLHATTVRLG